MTQQGKGEEDNHQGDKFAELVMLTCLPYSRVRTYDRLIYSGVVVGRPRVKEPVPTYRSWRDLATVSKQISEYICIYVTAATS